MKFIILIPTFNEADTIETLLRNLESFRTHDKVDFDVLVIDDHSPDGTASIVEGLHLPWVEVMKRKSKDGLGPAYRAGFTHVLRDDRYDQIITMDADGSHRVQDLPAMIAGVKNGRSIVLGTRWMPGGSVINWPKHRLFLSRIGTAYARIALRLPLDDLTGGFRIYSAELLRSLKITDMNANGYCFQIEMAMASHLAGAVETQIPITFIERRVGRSKMSRAIVREALIQTTLWGLYRALRPNADKLHYVKLPEKDQE